MSLTDFLNDQANSKLNILSKTKLQAILLDKGFDKAEIKAHFQQSKKKEIVQIYAKPRNNFKFKITATLFSFQIDVALLPAYKTSNNGISQFFIATDILSRKAFAYPLNSGKMADILEVYKKFISDTGVPVASVAGDAFFDNAEFKDFNNRQYINLSTSVAKDDHISKFGDKLAIVDRCIRTIKQLIQKYMLINNTTKWTSFIKEIVDLYNDTPNSGIQDMTPNEVYDDVDYMRGLYKGQKNHNKDVAAAMDKKYKVGDTVRAIVGKGIFEKEKARFSKELYVIHAKSGYSFVIKDEAGVLITRKYRPSELLVVDKDVIERLGKNDAKSKVEKQHKVTNKIVRSKVVDTYAQAADLLAKNNEVKTRPVRAKKKINKLDL